VRAVVTAAIHGYRKHVSPHKGFHCAYAVLHHRASCSCYALRLVERVRLVKVLLLMRRRFSACRAAYMQLALASGPETGQRRRRHKKDGDSGFCAHYCFGEAVMTGGWLACSPW
jgi:uncharacterized protein